MRGPLTHPDLRRVCGTPLSYLEDSSGAPLRKVLPPGPRALVKPSDLEEDVHLFEAEKVAATDELRDGNVGLPGGSQESCAAFIGVPAEHIENIQHTQPEGVLYKPEGT